MKKVNRVIHSIKNLLGIGINYTWLYSSPWTRAKSDYLRKKLKGKKSIRWDEKKGKGTYFDKRLRHFVNYPLFGSNEEVKDFKP